MTIDLSEIADLAYSKLLEQRGRSRERHLDRDDVVQALAVHAEAVAAASTMFVLTRVRHVVPNSYGYRASSDVVEIESINGSLMFVWVSRGAARTAPHGRGDLIVTHKTNAPQSRHASTLAWSWVKATEEARKAAELACLGRPAVDAEDRAVVADWREAHCR